MACVDKDISGFVEQKIQSLKKVTHTHAWQRAGFSYYRVLCSVVCKVLPLRILACLSECMLPCCTTEAGGTEYERG